MTFKIVQDAEGNRELVREPRSGYAMARSQGNMVQAVYYLSQEREDWFSFLLNHLSAEHRIPRPTMGILLCLSYVRRPCPIQKVIEWTNELMGGDCKPGLEDCMAWLRQYRYDGTLGFNRVENILLFPFGDDQIQISDRGTWNFPEFPETTEKEG